mmetsp:Transcript_23367/g.28707  ORF Transcript_23367/g.28707 Transcript_23367/m.28707 type:complete len:81 (+) Transcript_23367:138-380(+)
MIQLTLKPLTHHQQTISIVESERDHTTDTIRTMLQKEKTVYNCNDYNSTNYNVEKKRMHRAEIFEEFNVLVDTYSRQKNV